MQLQLLSQKHQDVGLHQSHEHKLAFQKTHAPAAVLADISCWVLLMAQAQLRQTGQFGKSSQLMTSVET